MNIKKIKPVFNKILVTANRYKKASTIDGTVIIDTHKTVGALMEYQTVVAIGDTVRNVKVGDLICIDPTRYAQRKHQEGSMRDGVITDNPVTTYNFNVIELDGVPHLMLSDNDVAFIIEEKED